MTGPFLHFNTADNVRTTLRRGAFA